ncbi:hypothetical protein, partial [Sporosarcina highlanderae]
LHFYYKKIVAQTMAMVCTTNVSMFPPAWLEPPRSRKACALWGLKAHAFPAGKAVTKNGFCEQKRSVVSTSLHLPPYASINGNPFNMTILPPIFTFPQKVIR